MCLDFCNHLRDGAQRETKEEGELDVCDETHRAIVVPFDPNLHGTGDVF